MRKKGIDGLQPACRCTDADIMGRGLLIRIRCCIVHWIPFIKMIKPGLSVMKSLAGDNNFEK